MEGFIIVDYDTEKFPFYKEFQKMMEVSDTNLAELHLDADVCPRTTRCPFYYDALILSGAQVKEDATSTPNNGEPDNTNKNDCNNIKASTTTDNNKPNRVVKKKTRNHRWKIATEFKKSKTYSDFLDLYHTFVLKVIGPLLPQITTTTHVNPSSNEREDLNHDNHLTNQEKQTLHQQDCSNNNDNNNISNIGKYSVVYQVPPTLRCFLGKTSRTSGKLHCDADYDPVQINELNIWLPVTDVKGSNTLWIESFPGKGDFKPIEMTYGQFAIFWGHKCAHYVKPNDSNGTRCSFDFRVIPGDLFFEDHKGRKDVTLYQKWCRVAINDNNDSEDENNTNISDINKKYKGTGDMNVSDNNINSQFINDIKLQISNHYKYLSLKA